MPTEYNGGGVSIYAGHGSMNNTLIARNTCNSYGGGLYCYAGGDPVRNCTITENRSKYYYGGVDCNFSGELHNSIIYYNSATIGKDDIGGMAGIAYNCCISVLSTNDGLDVFENCITNQPAFADRVGFDYRLLADSPCLDTGSEALAVGELDLAGIGRIIGPGVDMGCYEYGFVTNALAPPPITSPVAVSSGGAGVLLLTNQTSLTVAGSKNGGDYAVAPWRTNGIAQTTGPGATTWTHANLPLIPAVGGAIAVYAYATASADLYTISSNQTTLTVINYRMLPFLDITNTDFWVTFDVTEAEISGTNNIWTIGNLTWSNSKGGGGVFPAAPSWTIAVSNLAIGNNAITVSGTNELGDVTSDNVTVTRYVEGTGTPVVGITNAPAWVYYNEATAAVAGTNLNIVGQMWWTNDRVPGETNLFNPGFSVNVTGLAYGDNLIAICGTNVFGVVACDSVSIRRQTLEDRTAVTNYVWRDNPNPSIPPYESWHTAATSIQDAVCAIVPDTYLGTLVLVTNGLYPLTDWVTVNDCITVASVNGPEFTVIDGGYPNTTNRCFTINHALAVVDGFTISNAYWTPNGGGAFIGQKGGTLRNCVFVNCRAGEKGGGMYLSQAGRVEDCRFMQCSAGAWGGGVHLEQGGSVYNSMIRNCNAVTFGGGISVYGGGRLYSCLVVSNTANRGGGIYTRYYPSRLDNCTVVSNTAVTEGAGIYIREGPDMRGTIVWGNTAPTNVNWYKFGTVSVQDSCTTPSLGSNCITNDPRFIDAAGWNFRLMPDSPCVNAAPSYNWMNGITDLDGAPRILGPAVDLGCYEADPENDWDSDGVNDGDEWVADTDPIDSADYFCITGMSVSSRAEVRFSSSSNRVYTLYCSSNLVQGGWTPVPGGEQHAGTGGPDSLTDTNPPASDPAYRVGVDLP